MRARQTSYHTTMTERSSRNKRENDSESKIMSENDEWVWPWPDPYQSKNGSSSFGNSSDAADGSCVEPADHDTYPVRNRNRNNDNTGNGDDEDDDDANGDASGESGCMLLSDIAKRVARIDATSMDYPISEPWRATSVGSAEGRGSGWFVDMPEVTAKKPGTWWMVTCFHCVAGTLQSGGLFVRTGVTGSRRIPARVVAVMPDIDAALIQVNAPPDAPFATWRLGDDKTLRTNERVRVYGYPGGQSNLKVVRSTINGRQDGALQIDGAVNHGHSGGPVVKDARVVGWVAEGVTGSNSMVYAKPVTFLWAAMPRLIKIALQNLPAVGQRPLPIPVLHSGGLGLDLIVATTALIDLVQSGDKLSRNGRPFDASGVANKNGGAVVRWISRQSPLRTEADMRSGDVIEAVTLPIAVPGGQAPPWRFRVDRDGGVRVPWAPSERSRLTDVLAMTPVGSKCTVEFMSAPVLRADRDQNRNSNGDGNDNNNNNYRSSKSSLTLRLSDDLDTGGLHPIYPPFERPDFEAFAGMVVCELNQQLTASFDDISVLPKSVLENPAVVVVQVFPGSMLAQSDDTDGGAVRAPVSSGDIILSVNGYDTPDIDSYRYALSQPINGRYMLLEVRDDFRAVLDMGSVAAEEPGMARTFGYPSSATARALVGKYAPSDERGNAARAFGSVKEQPRNRIDYESAQSVTNSS